MRGASGCLRIYLTASTMARNSPMLFVLLPMEWLKSSNPEERSTSPSWNVRRQWLSQLLGASFVTTSYVLLADAESVDDYQSVI